MSNTVRLIICIFICQLAGVIGMILTMDSQSGWYASLNKPSFNPPDWLIAPVWVVLYLLMGISLFLIWKEGLKNKEVKTAFILFIIQLIFNVLWPVVFFGGHSIPGGLIVLIILWLLILITIIKFKNISRTAAILLIPYLLWVSFATLLNFFIYKLN
ncbi:MAG: tryptophan-rich sensory protein [Bacteroidota bacterium]|nr:tryptophan-rich sensory protein [Bacteroidota bacterium]